LRITDVANLYHVSTHAIRFYEKKGLINIPRDARGHRQFGNDTLKKLEVIVHYRKVNMPIEDIKKILTHAHDHDLSSQLLNKLKVNIENDITKLRQNLKYVRNKTEIHEALRNKCNRKS